MPIACGSKNGWHVRPSRPRPERERSAFVEGETGGLKGWDMAVSKPIKELDKLASSFDIARKPRRTKGCKPEYQKYWKRSKTLASSSSARKEGASPKANATPERREALLAFMYAYPTSGKRPAAGQQVAE